MSKRRDNLVSKQPINWAFIDLVSPLPWQTNHFDVNLPFVYAGPSREPIGVQSQFYSGQVRPREQTEVPPYDHYDHYNEHIDQLPRLRGAFTPPPQPTIPINLEGSATGSTGRNPRIRHPPMQNTRDGSMFYAGSSLPQHIHMPLSGQQAQRPTYGAAAAA